DGRRALYRARESERDQSYFLFATTSAQLDLLRFPLGDRTKLETRELARRFGLAVADKQDSQDICFVPSGRYADVIERLRPGAAGAPPHLAKSSISTAACSAAMMESSISPSASAAGSALLPARRSTLCGSMRHRDASWLVRAKRCAPAVFACAISTGSATGAL